MESATIRDYGMRREMGREWPWTRLFANYLSRERPGFSGRLE